MTEQEEKLLENFIRREVRKNLNESSPEFGQSKPVQVGNLVVTVGLKTGRINIYNKNMTKKLVQIQPHELPILLKMSKRKNTDEGGE